MALELAGNFLLQNGVMARIYILNNMNINNISRYRWYVIVDAGGLMKSSRIVLNINDIGLIKITIYIFTTSGLD